MYSLTVDIYKL